MQKKHLSIVIGILVTGMLSLIISTCEPGQLLGTAFTPTSTPTLTPVATPTSTPTQTPPPTPIPPTYSQVIATYPAGSSLCKNVADVTEVGPDGQPYSFNGTFFSWDMKCYGIKLTAKVPVTINGIVYPVGTFLTVDKDKNYIVVSSLQ